MNRAVSPGVLALLLTFLGGIWLVVSPFALQHQPAGAAWTRETINNVAAGGLLTVVSLLGIAVYLALTLAEVVRLTALRRAAEPPADVDA